MKLAQLFLSLMVLVALLMTTHALRWTQDHNDQIFRVLHNDNVEVSARVERLQQELDALERDDCSQAPTQQGPALEAWTKEPCPAASPVALRDVPLGRLAFAQWNREAGLWFCVYQ